MNSPSYYLPHLSTHLSYYDHGTTWSLYLPIRTPASPISISNPCSSALLPHYIFTRTTFISSPVRHVLFPHRRRSRIQLRRRCCERQSFLHRATWWQSSSHFRPNVPPQRPNISSPRFRANRVLLVLWYRSLSWGLPPLHLSPLPCLRPRTPSDFLFVHPMRLL